MELDLGMLAKIDQRVFAELAHAIGSQAVKVPVSDAAWSTWRRYCAAIGLSMGEGVAGLITHELRTIVEEVTDAGVPVFAGRREEELAARKSQIAARERNLMAVEERLHGWTERLGIWEGELRAREHRLELDSKPAAQSKAVDRKIGRNERCPCGSGLKYKRCHGS